jgi:hypothetical protein
MTRIRFVFLCLTVLAETVFATNRDYNGPEPQQADLPYLVHADHLLPTEQAEARDESDRKRYRYRVSGTSSSVRTPMPEPMFLIRAESLAVDRLQLYPMEIEKGARQIEFRKKPSDKDPRPIPLTYKERDDGLIWMEVNQILDNGEYCLSPQGTNTVFCFQVY